MLEGNSEDIEGRYGWVSGADFGIIGMHDVDIFSCFLFLSWYGFSSFHFVSSWNHWRMEVCLFVSGILTSLLFFISLSICLQETVVVARYCRCIARLSYFIWWVYYYYCYDRFIWPDIFTRNICSYFACKLDQNFDSGMMGCKIWKWWWHRLSAIFGTFRSQYGCTLNYAFEVVQL